MGSCWPRVYLKREPVELADGAVRERSLTSGIRRPSGETAMSALIPWLLTLGGHLVVGPCTSGGSGSRLGLLYNLGSHEHISGF